MTTTAQEEISLILDRQQEAWNRSDAAGYSADCDENVSFTNIVGQVFFGCKAFEEKHAQIFATIFKESTLNMSVRRIHFPASNVAVVDIEVQLSGYQALPPGVKHPADSVLRTRLLQVFVHSDVGWRVVAYHNVDTKI